MSPSRIAPIAFSSILVLEAFLPGLGCSNEDDRTEIVVVVDTDLEVPAEVSSIRVEVTSPTDETKEAASQSLSPDEQGQVVGLLYNEGPLGPFSVRATGVRGATAIIEREARVSFVPGRTMVVELHLVASCLSTTCEPGTTCDVDGCRPVEIDPSEYVDWTGTVPGIDADAGTDAD